MDKQLSPYSDGVNLCLDELLYYKQQAIKWLPPAKSLWSQMLGQHQSKQLGRGMDFAEVRQYQPGDDVRSIDWRVTARTGKPHTKLFTEEREKPIIVYVDFSASMMFGSQLMFKSVLASHMASLIAWLSVAQRDRIGAMIDTGDQLTELKPTSRNQGPLALIQHLVKLHQDKLNQSTTPHSSDMGHGLQALNRLCPKGSEVVIISDFLRFSESNQPLLTRLRAHNRVRLVHISDPLEAGITSYRGVEQVSDKRQTLWMDFSSRKARDQIKSVFEQKQQDLKDLSINHGLSFTRLSTQESLLQQLSGRNQ
ncbi:MULTISPECIES: DUF58 domain-containing protein [Vibrio]|uniref:DUF58 domain-containing protein n=1 Tax=Vibrio TaxID=662 RepID=UPI001268012C|nr:MULTISPECIES: DUF58 domain-containing protein [Vibrio]MCM5508472.1 DUF58 domain-containing protein [Vibrio sp. SCSIO 43169]NRF30562.1 DUF58 domain-containing protein [Vibrio coralliilyticus]NRF55569.1 DUF58 domain-containing protein [Vibrio coralliilyticus]NRG05801.1 DUF58 domain-containing protein [Vibrio coralliilyticus]QFT38423.1 VWA domain containing CoxE-like protein [Vibrio sp. THAF64]